MTEPAPSPGPVDELELLRPSLPIKVVRQELDAEQVQRWARQVVEIIGVWKVGPAGVMKMMETDRFCREIPEEYREPVARRALELRRMDGKEPKEMAGVTKRERMRTFLRNHLRKHPSHDVRLCYRALPPSERTGLSETSFGTTYFYPLQKQLRKAGEIPEPGVSGVSTSDAKGTDTPAPESATSEPKRVAPDPEDQPSPDAQASVVDPREEEPEEAERSEAAPSLGEVVKEVGAQMVETGQVMADRSAREPTPIILLEREGRGRLEVRQNGNGHSVHLVLAGADEDLVSSIAGVAWQEIIGMEAP
jgi:hypothetical protein